MIQCIHTRQTRTCTRNAHIRALTRPPLPPPPPPHNKSNSKRTSSYQTSSSNICCAARAKLHSCVLRANEKHSTATETNERKHIAHKQTSNKHTTLHHPQYTHLLCWLFPSQKSSFACSITHVSSVVMSCVRVRYIAHYELTAQQHTRRATNHDATRTQNLTREASRARHTQHATQMHANETSLT